MQGVGGRTAMDSGRFDSFVAIYNNLPKLSSGLGDACPPYAGILTHPQLSVSHPVDGLQQF